MSHVSVIGLPTKLLKRITAVFVRHGRTVAPVLAALSKEGYFRLMPDPAEAINMLQTYLDELPDGDLAQAKVIVLPYTPIPADLKAELSVLETDFGGTVVRIKPGENGWPLATVGQFNEAFHEEVFSALTSYMFPGLPVRAPLPSERFADIAAHNNIIIPKAAIAICDSVARHRFKFMLRAADALEELAENGPGDGIEEFFDAFDLDHAQSGGVSAGLEVFRDGKNIHKGSCHTHLKEGDGTKKIAAARVYYYRFKMEEVMYVAVLYAGPHPDADITRQYTLS